MPQNMVVTYLMGAAVLFYSKHLLCIEIDPRCTKYWSFTASYALIPMLEMSHSDFIFTQKFRGCYLVLKKIEKNRVDLIKIFKILTRKCNINYASFFSIASSGHLRDNSLKLFKGRGE